MPVAWCAMRLGVLDVGSNTVHLLVVDAHPGAQPLPAFSTKEELRLAELLDGDGAITEEGVQRLIRAVASAMRVAEDKGVEEMLPFATSAVREAANGEAVLERVEREAGVALRVLSGRDEARLTFLAARRWFGWSFGRMMVLDIGGGSLEIACGPDERADVAISLPLGAGRLTSGRLQGDPPDPEDIRKVRRRIRAEIAKVVGDVSRLGAPDHAVATSKTFKQLARMSASGRSDGPRRLSRLTRSGLTPWVPRLATMTVAERARIPGVLEGRAPQLLAGALVADAAMELFKLDKLDICPWALREGVILRRLDMMTVAGNGSGYV